MSVIHIGDPQEIKHQGFGQIEDIREPLGIWWFTEQLPGDGTGGSGIIQLLFPTSYIYNIERFMYHSSASISVILQAVMTPPWIPLIGGGTASFVTSHNLEGNGVSGSGLIDRHPLPFWGTPTRTPTSGGINFNTQRGNPGIGITDTLSLWGYYWDLAAQRAAGGPLRPETR